MSHPLVLTLFPDHASAARGAAAMRQLGVASVDLSIVARDHAEEGRLARAIGGTPGVEIEDSAVAARLGGVWAETVAAIALVMPGIGPIVGAGPLGAALSEFAGHAAGGVASMLKHANIPSEAADVWETRIRDGAPLIGVHVRAGDPATVAAALSQAGAESVHTATWP